jgi:hypothetical protein
MGASESTERRSLLSRSPAAAISASQRHRREDDMETHHDATTHGDFARGEESLPQDERIGSFADGAQAEPHDDQAGSFANGAEIEPHDERVGSFADTDED